MKRFVGFFSVSLAFTLGCDSEEVVSRPASGGTENSGGANATGGAVGTSGHTSSLGGTARGGEAQGGVSATYATGGVGNAAAGGVVSSGGNTLGGATTGGATHAGGAMAGGTAGRSGVASSGGISKGGVANAGGSNSGSGGVIANGASAAAGAAHAGSGKTATGGVAGSAATGGIAGANSATGGQGGLGTGGVAGASATGGQGGLGTGGVAGASATGGIGTAGTTAVARCSNGITEAPEECDDGNRVNADGCNNDCVKSGSTVWSRRYPYETTHDAAVNGVAVDHDGNVITVGSTWSSTLGPEMLVWKLAANGDYVKHRVIPTGVSANYTDALEGVAVNSTNQIAIVGSAHTTSITDTFTMKRVFYGLLAPDLGDVWTAVTPESGEGHTVTIDSADRMYFGGTTLSSNATSRDLWVRKVNGPGHVVAWTGTYDYNIGYTCDEHARSIAISPTGEVWVVGERLCHPSTIATVWRFSDATGAYRPMSPTCREWSFSGAYAAYAQALVVLPTGGITFAGERSAVGTRWHVPNNFNPVSWCGAGDAAVTTYSFTATSRINGMVLDGAGHLIVAGTLGTVTKTNLDGTVRWTKALTTPDGGTLEFTGIAIDANGYIHLSAVKPATLSKVSEAWVLKLSP